MYIHSKKLMTQKILFMAGLAFYTHVTYADESFFTIVDSQGRPLNIAVGKHHTQPTVKSAVLNKKAESNWSSASPRFKTNTSNKTKSDVSSQGFDSVPRKKSTDLYLFDHNAYIDSDELQKKAFNQDGKKKFFSIPNNFGGVDQVEKRAGVVTHVDNNILAPVIALEVSTTYKVLNKDELASLLPKQCVPKKQLKKLKKLGTNASLNLWIKQQKRIKKGFYEIPVTLVQLTEKVNYIQLTSYSHSSNNPHYYWPLAVFLDNKGCVISAVKDFHQGDIAATWLQKPGMFGNLLAPEKSAYLLLTPLAESPKIIDKKLTNTGSVKLSTESSKIFNFK